MCVGVGVGVGAGAGVGGFGVSLQEGGGDSLYHTFVSACLGIMYTAAAAAVSSSCMLCCISVSARAGASGVHPPTHSLTNSLTTFQYIRRYCIQQYYFSSTYICIHTYKTIFHCIH